MSGAILDPKGSVQHMKNGVPFQIMYLFFFFFFFLLNKYYYHLP